MAEKNRRWLICRLDEAGTLRLLQREICFPPGTRIEAVSLEDGLLSLRLQNLDFLEVSPGDQIPLFIPDSFSGGPHVDRAHQRDPERS